MAFRTTSDFNTSLKKTAVTSILSKTAVTEEAFPRMALSPFRLPKSTARGTPAKVKINEMAGEEFQYNSDIAITTPKSGGEWATMRRKKRSLSKMTATINYENETALTFYDRIERKQLT